MARKSMMSYQNAYGQASTLKCIVQTTPAWEWAKTNEKFNDLCAANDFDSDGLPDTIVAGCTTTLTEDLDDDSTADKEDLLTEQEQLYFQMPFEVAGNNCVHLKDPENA